MSTHELTIKKTVEAPREDVFAAFTQKAELEKWFCPESMTARIDELDLKVGGAIVVSMVGKDGTHTARGVFKEIEAPEKLVYTWQWQGGGEGMSDETLVTIELLENGGKTDIVFTHGGFSAEKPRDMHKEGWASAFRKFEQLF